MYSIMPGKSTTASYDDLDGPIAKPSAANFSKSMSSRASDGGSVTKVVDSRTNS